jgi:hypothetical protein
MHITTTYSIKEYCKINSYAQDTTARERKYIFLFFNQEYVRYWSQTYNGVSSRCSTCTKVKAVLVGGQQYIAFQQGVNTACCIFVTAVLDTVSEVRGC